MPRATVPVRSLILSVTALVLLPAAAAAQPALPTGAPQSGKATESTPATYTLAAKTAGVLTVAVQGANDLELRLLDSDGQAVQGGTSDQDLNGSSGTELLSATITEAGTYKLEVRVLSGGDSTFQISSSFLSFPPFARPADPDRRPSQARALVAGKPHEDSLDSDAGDTWDWFVFKVAEAGTLAIITRQVGEGDADLQLEVFLNNDFATPADRSDQDQQGNAANESVTIAVEAGQSVHVRVSSPFSNIKARYRLQSSLIK
jgi:hypothetical protein